MNWEVAPSQELESNDDAKEDVQQALCPKRGVLLARSEMSDIDSLGCPSRMSFMEP